MTSLATTYCGAPLDNPVLVGACALTENYEGLHRIADQRAAGAVMKTLFACWPGCRRWPTPRFRVLRRTGDRSTAETLYSREFPNLLDPKLYFGALTDCKERLAKEGHDDFKVFASIQCFSDASEDREGGAGSDKDLWEWEKWAQRAVKAQADGLELNLSMPLLHETRFARRWDVGEVAAIVAAAREGAPEIKLAVKLSSQTSRLLDIAAAARSMGADAIVLFNRSTALDFNIETGEPLLQNTYAAFGSPWVLQNNLAQVAYVARDLQENDEELDICGSGGIFDGRDVIKYIMAGASAVQVTTAVYLHGYDVIGRIIQGLERSRPSGATVGQLKGRVASALRDHVPLDSAQWRPKPATDKACRKCGRCLQCCPAITAVEPGDRGDVRCQGCGLCVELCPNEALVMSPVVPASGPSSP